MSLNNLNVVAVSTATESKHNVYVYPYKLIFNGLFSKENEMIKGLISEKILDYQTRIGYPVPITVQEVQDYLGLATIAFTNLLQVHRSQNGHQATDVFSRKIGDVYCDFVEVKPAGVSRNFTNIAFNANPLTNHGFRVKGGENISNAVWTRTINRANNLIRLPLAWANLMDYFLKGFFVNSVNSDDGVTEVIKFQTNMFTASTETALQILTDSIEYLESELNKNSNLMGFLELEMGLLKPLDFMDLTRDLAAQTLIMIEDNKVIEALETDVSCHFNGNVNIPSILENSELIYSPENKYYTPFSAPMLESLEIEEIMETVLLMEEKDDTDEPHLYSSFMMVTPEGVEWSIPTMTGDIDLSDAVSTAMDNFPLDLPFRPKVNSFAKDATSVKFEELTIQLKSGVNLFKINEDDLLDVKHMLQLDMISQNMFNPSSSYINRLEGIGIFKGQNVSEKDVEETKPKRNRNRNRN